MTGTEDGTEEVSLKDYQSSYDSVGRSMSFQGLRRQSPTTPTSPMGGTGYYYQNTKGNRKSMPASLHYNPKKSKIPKVPRPSRTKIVFASVRRGIEECIKATQDDLSSLKTATGDATAGSSAAQQSKSAERFQKRLEFQLSKIEELEENYLLHLQLRDGARNMAKAYSSLAGNNQKQAIDSVKYGYKEYTQTLCAIEAQLENMLGTFHLKMKGMEGFARIIPGDVYEVSMKHGQQKWKTKGKMGTSTQNWAEDSAIFKALVGEIFTVKAVECKGLGKSVILGQKNCETKDLFSSHPQMMTVSINITGSLKLSIVITWNPLEAVDETMMFFEPQPRSTTTPLRKKMYEDYRKSLPPYLNGLSDISSSVPTRRTSPEHQAGVHTADNRLSVPNNLNSRSLPSRNEVRPNSIAVVGSFQDSANAQSTADLNMQKPKLFDMRLLSDSLMETTPTRVEPVTLDEALHNLNSSLEDYRGQYSELQKLETQLVILEKLLRKFNGAGSTRSSNVSISIENALEAFDFLEAVEGPDAAGAGAVSGKGAEAARVLGEHTLSRDYCEKKASIENALGAFDFLESDEFRDGFDSGSQSQSSSLDQLEASYTLSPESTTKTADSGIESIANRLSEDRALETSMGSSPEPPSCGNEQVDVALLWHLSYCDRLLENLGCYGPLKCKEIYSVDKLQKQADILESLNKIAKSGPGVKDLHAVMSQLTPHKSLKQFWLKCTESAVLYVSAEKLMNQLQRGFGDAIREKYDIAATKVFKTMVARILDVPNFDPELSRPPPNITLHQFMNHLEDQKMPDMYEYLQELAGEVWMSGRLKSGNTDIVIKTILTFRDTIPAPDCLRVVGLLLITADHEVRNTATSYIKGLSTDVNLRDKAMITYVEALEDRNADVRCAACMALKYLRATESMDQLTYVCQTDASQMVKTRAKEALLSYGEEGQKAVEQSELSSHGFQGIQMRL